MHKLTFKNSTGETVDLRVNDLPVATQRGTQSIDGHPISHLLTAGLNRVQLCVFTTSRKRPDINLEIVHDTQGAQLKLSYARTDPDFGQIDYETWIERGTFDSTEPQGTHHPTEWDRLCQNDILEFREIVDSVQHALRNGSFYQFLDLIRETDGQSHCTRMLQHLEKTYNAADLPLRMPDREKIGAIPYALNRCWAPTHPRGTIPFIHYTRRHCVPLYLFRTQGTWKGTTFLLQPEPDGYK